MTREQQVQVLAEVLGECWHDFLNESYIDELGYLYTCRKCKEYLREQYNPFSGSRLSYETIDKIIEKMPEVWETYLDTERMIIWRKATNILNDQLNAANFLDYLWEHQEWGLSDCTKCIFDGFVSLLCQTCNGTGKIKHPALVLLEKYKED